MSGRCVHDLQRDQCAMCEPPMHKDFRVAMRGNWTGGGWRGPTDAPTSPPSGGSSVKLVIPGRRYGKRARLK